jgi:hypothetical protein
LRQRGAAQVKVNVAATAGLGKRLCEASVVGVNEANAKRRSFDTGAAARRTTLVLFDLGYPHSKSSPVLSHRMSCAPA